MEHEVSHSAGAVESIGEYNLKINSRRNEAKQIENRDKKEHKKMRRHQRELEAEKKRLEAAKPKSSLSITRLLARQVSPKSVSTKPRTHEATGVASIQREEEDEPATGSGDHSRCLPWLSSRLAANLAQLQVAADEAGIGSTGDDKTSDGVVVPVVSDIVSAKLEDEEGYKEDAGEQVEDEEKKSENPFKDRDGAAGSREGS